MVGAIVKKLNEANDEKSNVFVILAIGPEGGMPKEKMEKKANQGFDSILFSKT